MGLSSDFTYLEKVKYGKDSNREEFNLVHKRLYLVLLVLGFIIEDLPLRRLCVEAAIACEFTTNNSKLILQQLPHSCINNVICSAGRMKIYNDLRSLLGNIRSAIKIKKKLVDFYERSSVKCYEKLQYLNNTLLINTELKSLIYPGTERTRKYNVENVPPPQPDFHQVLQDNQNFLKDISQRFQLLYDPFESLQDYIVPPKVTLYEIRQMFINQLNNCMDFHIKANDLYFLMTSITLDQMSNYHNYLNDQIKQLLEQNADTLYFDFTNKRSEDYEPKKFDVAAAYNDGVISLWDITSGNSNIFDIENIMFYAIHLKKVHCKSFDFPQINRNCTIPAPLQLQNTFCYLVFRGQPGLSRVSCLKTMTWGAFSFLDLIDDLFDFDIVKFKYSRKNKNCIDSHEILDVSAIEYSTVNELVTDISMEVDPTQEKVDVRKKVPKKGHRKEAQSNVIDSTTTSTPQSQLEIVKLLTAQKEPKPKSIMKKRIIIPTFNGTEVISQMLLLLENELSMIIDAKVTLVMSTNSPIIINGKESDLRNSQIKINLHKNRGHSQHTMINILTVEKNFTLTLPFTIRGFLKINIEVLDSIVYINNFREEPKIETKITTKIIGNLLIDQLKATLLIDVKSPILSDSKIILGGSGKGYRKNEKKRVMTPEPVTVQEIKIVEFKKECEKSASVVNVESKHENDAVCHYETVVEPMNLAFDQFEPKSECTELIVEPLNDVEMSIIAEQSVHYQIEKLKDISICKVEEKQLNVPSQFIVKENGDVELELDVLTEINPTEPGPMVIEQTEVIVSTIELPIENTIKSEPTFIEPLLCNEITETNVSESLEVVNLQTTTISPEQNVPQHIIMEVPHIIENEYDVKPDLSKLNVCCIDLTNDNDNDKYIPNFSLDSGPPRTYSKMAAKKTLQQQQLTIKPDPDAIDFETMMPCAQLVIPKDLLKNEAERARWRCDMTKQDAMKVLPVKHHRHRPGPACHNKSKSKISERKSLHSVNRNSNFKQMKKCSVVLFNCLQDIHLGELRTNVDLQKKKVNLQLPANVSVKLQFCC